MIMRLSSAKYPGSRAIHVMVVANVLISTVIKRTPDCACPAATGSEVQPENYSLEGLLRRELMFTPTPKDNVLRTLYTLRLYPALKSSERVRL